MPIAEAEGNAAKVQKFLGKSLDESVMPPIKSLLLFSNKEVQMNITDPAVPVVQTNELKAYLREQGKQRTISAEQRKQISEILGGKD